MNVIEHDKDHFTGERKYKEEMQDSKVNHGTARSYAGSGSFLGARNNKKRHINRVVMIMLVIGILLASGGAGWRLPPQHISFEKEVVRSDIETPHENDIGSVDVHDAFSYAGTADFGDGEKPVEYHLPEVTIDGVSTDQVNADFRAGYGSFEGWPEEVSERGYDSMLDVITYDWSVSGDILSVLFINRYDWGTLWYSVRNISTSTGEDVSDADVLAQAGLTLRDFYILAEDTIHKNFSKYLSKYCYGMDEDTAFEHTEPVSSATPFFNSQGHLSMIAHGVPTTGDGPYLFLFDLETQELFEIPGYEMATLDDPEELEQEDPAEDPFLEEPTEEGIPIVEDAGIEVRDAFSYSGVYPSQYGEQFDIPVAYHVPEVIRNGEPIDKINERLWEDLYGSVESGGYIGEEQEFLDLVGMEYDWYINGDILSLLVVTEENDENGVFFHRVYNISVSQGEFLSKNAVLNQAGMSSIEYNRTLAAMLKSYVDACYDQYVMINFPQYPEEYKINAVINTLEDDHLDMSSPFINESGDLCVVALLWNCYVPAEAYEFLFDLDTWKVFGEQAHRFGTDELDVVQEKAIDYGDGVWEVYNYEVSSGYNGETSTYEQLLINPSAHRYILTTNLLDAYGTVTGKYTEEDNGLLCTVEEKGFAGFGGDDITEFVLQREGNDLFAQPEPWYMQDVLFEYDRDFTLKSDYSLGTVMGDRVRFRSGPSTDDIIMAELNRGDMVTITGIVKGSDDGEDWYMVEYTSMGLIMVGFMSSEYVARME